MRLDFTKYEYDYLIENCGFTDDELEVLAYKRRGWTNLEVACELYVSERTVKRRVVRIKNKILKVMTPMCPF